MDSVGGATAQFANDGMLHAEVKWVEALPARVMASVVFAKLAGTCDWHTQVPAERVSDVSFICVRFGPRHELRFACVVQSTQVRAFCFSVVWFV